MSRFVVQARDTCIGAIAGLCLLAPLHSSPARAQMEATSSTKPPGAVKGAETKPQKQPESGSAGRADGPASAPTVSETLTHVGEIAYEIKLLEKRLHALEQSVTAVNASIAPLGAAMKPEALREIMNQAGDIAHSRAQSLILLSAACGAGLLILHAVLRRWSNAPRKPGDKASP